MGTKQSTHTHVDANTQVTPVTSPRKSNRPTHEFLTESELTVAKTTWVRLQATKNMQSMGIKTFLRIFELEPETKEAFESFRTLNTEELTSNVLFRSHATRFMKAVEVTMNNLDALDVIIVPNLKHLGRLHTDFTGFRVGYLKAFEVAMEEVWTQELGSSFSGDCRIAWRKIFKLITSKVHEGYSEAQAERSQKNTPSPKSPSVKSVPPPDHRIQETTQGQINGKGHAPESGVSASKTENPAVPGTVGVNGKSAHPTY